MTTHVRHGLFRVWAQPTAIPGAVTPSVRLPLRCLALAPTLALMRMPPVMLVLVPTSILALAPALAEPALPEPALAERLAHA